MVVTSLGDAFTYNGVSWAQVASLPDYPPETITAYGPPSSYWAPAISCASASFCAVFTIGGKGYIYDGERWVEQIIEPRPNYTVQSEEYDWVAISCAVAGYCEVVENNGDAIDYTNGTWGSPQHVLTGLQHPVFVQCPTPNYCVAASSHETFTFNGATWLQTAAPPISLGLEMGSLSCPTVGFCAASADNGSVHLFRAAATLSLEATSAHLTYGAEQNERLSVELSSSASSVTGIVGITSPTGTVCSIRIVNGTGSCQLTPTQLPTGSTNLTADYSGTPTLAAASNQLLLTVAKVPVKVRLVLTHATARVGAEQSVRFDASVVPRYAGNATGSVVIKLVSGRVLCILTLDPKDTTSHGSCTLSNTELPVGTVAVEASFVGTDIFASGVSAPAQLRIVASTASNSGASGTIVETTCECATNVNGTWDYVAGTGNKVVGIITLTLRASATDQVSGTSVGVSASPLPGEDNLRGTVTGHISHGHLYIFVHYADKTDDEFWTTGLTPPASDVEDYCSPLVVGADPLSLSSYPQPHDFLFFPVATFQEASRHGATPHLGFDPGVSCTNPASPTTTTTLGASSFDGAWELVVFNAQRVVMDRVVMTLDEYNDRDISGSWTESSCALPNDDFSLGIMPDVPTGDTYNISVDVQGGMMTANTVEINLVGSNLSFEIGTGWPSAEFIPQGWFPTPDTGPKLWLEADGSGNGRLMFFPEMRFPPMTACGQVAPGGEG